MLETKIRAKIIGYFMLFPAIIILLGVIFATLFLSSFGFASGVSFIQIMPFFVLMLMGLFFAGLCVYIAIRYIKNNPFKQNQQLGTVFVFFSLIYFSYSLLVYILGNLFDNQGAFLKPVLAFLLLLILFPLGLGLKNGYKKA